MDEQKASKPLTAYFGNISGHIRHAYKYLLCNGRDSRMIAVLFLIVNHSHAHTHIVRQHSFHYVSPHELAGKCRSYANFRLQAPPGIEKTWIAFSPPGTHLIQLNPTAHASCTHGARRVLMRFCQLLQIHATIPVLNSSALVGRHHNRRRRSPDNSRNHAGCTSMS